MLLVGVPALAGILLSANAWRIEATLRLRTGNIGVVEQSAKVCQVDAARLPGVLAARDALAMTVALRDVATPAQFEHWLQDGRTAAVKRAAQAPAQYCENFVRSLDAYNRFWQARANRWKTDASGF